MSDAAGASVGRVAPVGAAGRGSTKGKEWKGSYRKHLVGGPRGVRVEVRFSAEEFASIGGAAADAGQRPASWLGEVGLRVAAGTGVLSLDPGGAGLVEDPKVVLVQQQMVAVMRVRGQLAAIGNNVNQIARAVNAGQPVAAAQAESVYSYLRVHVARCDAEVTRLRIVAGH